jgi:ABC-2 type transport system permease protein
MSKYLAIIRRELIAYFSSPLAYVMMAAFLLMQGFIFFVIVSLLMQPGSMPLGPMQMLFGGTLFFWLYMLVFIPVITMRLIAEELRSGTIEVLMTSPVTETQVVLGKTIAALIFYVSLWLPTVTYVFILNHHSSIDFGPVAAGYLGVFLLGFLFLSAGIFASTLARNQITAAIIGFGLLAFLFSIPLVDYLLPSTSFFKPIINHISLWSHMEDYARGIVDTRHIVYELSVGAFFLFLATRSLQVKKWR